MKQLVGAAVVVFLASTGATAAVEPCADQMASITKEWAAIFTPSSVGSERGVLPGRKAHGHTYREFEIMRSRLRLALRLCREGKEHEASLQLDVVRAWLKLPEVQHLADHRAREERR